MITELVLATCLYASSCSDVGSDGQKPPPKPLDPRAYFRLYEKGFKKTEAKPCLKPIDSTAYFRLYEKGLKKAGTKPCLKPIDPRTYFRLYEELLKKRQEEVKPPCK